MNEIINSESLENALSIQGVRCYEKDGVAFLNLEDVSRGLGFTQEKNGVEYVKWERINGYLAELGFSPEVGKEGLATSGRSPVYIPENIFYRLCMKAKNEAAERFQAKVADEIIPAIRKTGGYVANEDAFLQTYLPFADESTKALFRATLVTINDQNRKIAQQQEKIALDAPKVHFANSVESSQTSILIGTMAKILKQNGVNTGEKRLFQQLRHDGFLCDKGKRHNVPTQKAMEMGLFDMTERTFSSPSGETKISVTTKVTGKGQTYFLNRYAGKAVTTP